MTAFKSYPPLHVGYLYFPNMGLGCCAFSFHLLDTLGAKMVKCWIFIKKKKLWLDGDEDQHEGSDKKVHGFDQAAENMIKKVKQALAHGEGCRVFFFV